MMNHRETMFNPPVGREMLRVDREGVPTEVQKIIYLATSAMFKLTLLNGDRQYIDGARYINIMASPTRIPNSIFERVENDYLYLR